MTRDSAVVALSEPALLSAWEQGTAAAAVERPLILLHHASRALSFDEGVGWTVGRRDARLIDLCELTFGPVATGTAPCPSCGVSVEISFPLAAIRTDHGDAGSPLELVLDDGHRVTFRLPTTADLRNASQCRSDEDGARLLAVGCLLEGSPPDDTPLADSMIEALGSAMAEHDPQSDVSLEARCPACDTALTVNFDVADYVWRRVAMAGRELIFDVHQLAAAYGWSEAEILAIPAGRRHRYLELV
jgi:uncharacterized protein (UPF0212 family)